MPVLLALTAGMLGAVNPCGFALLPAYLSLLVSADGGPAGAAPVVRALRCTAALTAGYVAVFGAFGLVVAPLAARVQPHLPWLTVVLGTLLAAIGGWLVAGRSLPALGARLRAPRLTGSLTSTALFGAGYALASLGCAAGPFLAIVAASLRAGTIGAGLALFAAYALGMAIVVGVVAVAVALARTSAVTRLRRAAAVVPRLGGAVLLICGAYVAYYGWYELRLARDLRVSGHDPLVAAATGLQRRISDLIGGVGAGWLAVALLVLVAAGLRWQRRAEPAGAAGAVGGGAR
ncbi:cytochrome c biogenesis CcdA family protein [Krasilnikovia cinnamomea]|uniref:cytochrome c biogenesis CcdA family protein n=1 Tax=Krasilnikovia cinnamomea TaxID=349313 RepID=UPI001F5E64C9|nr:cytochrome c biogenesis CcdA family protein [Krasilnikovia cinnamomea]